MNIAAAKAAPIAPERLSAGEVVLFHFAPALAITLVFAGLAWLVRPLGWPASLALLLTWPIAGIPVLAGLLLAFGRRVNGRPGIDGVLLNSERLRGREYAWLIPALLVWAALASTLLYPLGEAIRQLLFPW